MNCQDNVGISVRDMWENLEQERKEIITNFWSEEALESLNYVIK